MLCVELNLMAVILTIEYVEEWEKDGKTIYRTHVVLDDGEEAVGFGNDFKIGESVERFYDFRWDTVKIQHKSVDK